MIQAKHIDQVIQGRARLTIEQAILLYHDASLHDLGRWASAVCTRIHGPTYRTYIIDRNVNYTNVCSAKCTFCAFRRDLGEKDAYTLDQTQLHQKLSELQSLGGTQVLLQGGMHPELPIEFYEQMLQDLKTHFPEISLHAFSPPEFVEFVAVFDLPGFPKTPAGKSHELSAEIWREKLNVILKRFKAAGMVSIPGGGGEIFAKHVRQRIGRGKATATQWLDVMSAGHQLGLNSSASMMFGHIESIADRIDHMARVRERQDLAIKQQWPGRFMGFISWPFQRENTPLGRLPDWDRTTGEPFAGEDPSHVDFGKVLRQASAVDYLRMQAVARLFLDNIHSIGSSWVTMGPDIGQLGLFYGANDMGSVMIEENVVSAAGTTYCLNEQVLCHLIREAGFLPAQRDNTYQLIKKFEPDNAPDLAVTDWSKHRVSKLHHESGQSLETLTPLTLDTKQS